MNESIVDMRNENNVKVPISTLWIETTTEVHHLNLNSSIEWENSTDPNLKLWLDVIDPGYQLRHGILMTVFLCIAYGVVFIIGVCGNIAVVAVTNLPRMRSLTYKFIANLAFADLLVNFLCVPFTLGANLFPAWIFGDVICKMVSYLQGVSVSASINTLMAISIERCIAVSFPLSGSMSEKQYKLVLCGIWVIAMTLNLPWLLVFTLEPLDIHGSHAQVCVESWPTPDIGNLYFVVVNLIVCYLGPLTVITICYTLIWRKVAKRNIPGEQRNNFRTVVRINKNKDKVVKMVLVVIITFAISWMPLYVIFSLIKFHEELFIDQKVQSALSVLLPLAQWLGASNSCINPIVYAFMSKKFRVSLFNFFRRTHDSSRSIDFKDFNIKHDKADSYYRSKRFGDISFNSRVTHV